jgi:putative transposase
MEIARPPSFRALTGDERETVRQVLNSERFQDCSPRQVYAQLLEEGVYYCDWRTMYRILAEHGEVRERRNQLQHPAYAKPELLATGPNQVWSWDITRLKGPEKWRYYYLYVTLDIFSRYVVSWLVAPQESEELGRQLIAAAYAHQGIAPGQLTVHADRGGPMKAKTMAQMLSDLGVTKSHARPHTSNDNPFSEAQFKTMKYRPDFPDRFGSIQDAREWCRAFFRWYNHQHHHSGLALMRPVTVHHGRAQEVSSQRQQVLSQAYARHPERFVRGAPTAPQLPIAVWINPPAAREANHDTLVVACAEDRATLESDPSADAGRGVDGRGSAPTKHIPDGNSSLSPHLHSMPKAINSSLPRSENNGLAPSAYQP